MIVPLLFGLGAVATVRAQEASEEGAVHAERNTSLTVPIYKSRVVTLAAPAKRVSIGNPDIADVLIIGAGELYILGKDLGATNVLLWDRSDQLIASISVSVTHDLDGLRKLLASTLPGAAESDCVAITALGGTRWSAAFTVVMRTDGPACSFILARRDSAVTRCATTAACGDTRS